MKSKRKPKNELVFDNSKREKFLTGFSKRKKIRKAKAQKELEGQLKEETKRIRLEAKDLKQRFKVSFAPLKIDEENEVQEEEFETEDVKVSITTLDDSSLKSRYIGVRKANDDNDDEEEEEEVEEGEPSENQIEGMEMSSKSKSASNKIQGKTDIKSEKDFKKMVKKQTKDAIKKSKIIQKKNQMNHKRNVQRSNKKKNMKQKFLKKHKKVKPTRRS